MKQYWKQHWLEYVLSAVLVSLAAGALTVLFGYSFSTNDDAMLRSIVSGSYTGTPIERSEQPVQDADDL